MMNTPICDFVSRYAEGDNLRLHMPGHKGIPLLGMEPLDITEIDGADSLYEAKGIIKHSEDNASALFGVKTFYSTEGCSQCIRAMLYLTVLHAKACGRRPVIAAARNVHKTFLSAAAMLDFDVVWLYPEQPDSYLSCKLDARQLDGALSQLEEKPVAVYMTSPDYLGNVAPIETIAEVCHKHGCLLLVDNAHGAYLHFLQPARHPMDLGADLCCSSAHKTLPVLTGGAYLHVAENAPRLFFEQAKNALIFFGSTSPSYLILQSLDAANAYLADDYSQKLAEFVSRVETLKQRLLDHGYILQGDEPLKLTVQTKRYGYTGTEFAGILAMQGIVCEFCDPDSAVMMLTPEISREEMEKLEHVLLSVPRKAFVLQKPPEFHRCERVLSVREAMLSSCETVPVAKSVGRVLAVASVGCPPAVPILVSGERIDESAAARLSYYAVEACTVVREGENI